jgi:hypothetical protein
MKNEIGTWTMKNASTKANGERKKAIGRPRIRMPADNERMHLGIRVTPEMKRRLLETSEANGRSLSQETELRIQQSFWLEDLLRARLISARIPASKPAAPPKEHSNG